MEDDLKENGHLLAKFEEVQGRFLHLKSLLKSQKSQINGFEYHINEQKKEIERLKNTNKTLKTKVGQLEQKLNDQNQLVPQNFRIKNKLIKIVSDIEDKGLVNLKDYLDELIEEIDICINQLSK